MDNDGKDDNGASIVAPSETPPLVNDGEKIAPVLNREDNDKVGAVESTPTDEMMKAFALSQGAEGLSAPTEEELEELARKEEDRVAEKKAKAKAEKKRRRNERRRQRALRPHRGTVSSRHESPELASFPPQHQRHVSLQRCVLRLG